VTFGMHLQNYTPRGDVGARKLRYDNQSLYLALNEPELHV